MTLDWMNSSSINTQVKKNGLRKSFIFMPLKEFPYTSFDMSLTQARTMKDSSKRIHLFPFLPFF